MPFKKQIYSNYQIHFWTITESSSLKLNLHPMVMVSFSLHIVFYKSSYPTLKKALHKKYNIRGTS